MDKPPILKVYIAGPDVFIARPEGLAERKKALCARHGLLGLHPLDAKVDEMDTPAETARAIAAVNRAMILEADAVVANLTPFRGVSADVGTVFELGFMAGLGRPSWGYTLDQRPYQKRVAPDGKHVEEYGLHDNLMIDCALQGMVTPAPGAGVRWEQHLWCFERCLEAVVAYFADADAGAP